MSTLNRATRDVKGVKAFVCVCMRAVVCLWDRGSYLFIGLQLSKMDQMHESILEGRICIVYYIVINDCHVWKLED